MSIRHTFTQKQPRIRTDHLNYENTKNMQQKRHYELLGRFIRATL
jgi:hypothetical protein